MLATEMVVVWCRGRIQDKCNENVNYSSKHDELMSGSGQMRSTSTGATSDDEGEQPCKQASKHVPYYARGRKQHHLQ